LNIIGVRGFKKRAQVFEIIKYKMTWRSEILRHSTLLSGGFAVLYIQRPLFHIPQMFNIKGRMLKVKASFETSFFVCVYDNRMNDLL